MDFFLKGGNLQILKIAFNLVPPHGVNFQVFARSDTGKYIVGTMPVVHRKNAPALLDELIEKMNKSGEHVTLKPVTGQNIGDDVATFGHTKGD